MKKKTKKQSGSVLCAVHAIREEKMGEGLRKRWWKQKRVMDCAGQDFVTKDV